jgi:hypothetical protein
MYGVSPTGGYQTELKEPFGDLPRECLFIHLEEFKENLRTNGEHMFTAIEQKRYEECSVAPWPSNDVIIGSVLAIWTDTVNTTLKSPENGYLACTTPQPALRAVVRCSQVPRWGQTK